MDIALITGADTALGQVLAEKLVRMGCRVHGLGNDFSNFKFADRNFHAHAVDLTDLEAVRGALEGILEEEGALHILVHAIDVTPGTSFETLAVGNLEAVLKVALLGPVLLTRLALPNLLRFRGQIVNVLSSNKPGRPASAVNRLIEDGLRGMNQALLDGARDRGLRLTNLILRHNETLPEGATELSGQARIDRGQLARMIERLLSGEDPNMPAEIVLHPRADAGAEALPVSPLPVDPYSRVVLPPKAYFPPEPEKIPTRPPDRIDRSIPYTEEELEDRIAGAIEDYENKAENRAGNRTGPDKDRTGEETGDEEGRKRSGRKRRRRGRRGKRGGGEGAETAAASPGSGQEPERPATPASQSGGKPAEPAEPKSKPSAKKKTARKAPKKKTTKKAAKKAARKATRKTTKKAARKDGKKDDTAG